MLGRSPSGVVVGGARPPARDGPRNGRPTEGPAPGGQVAVWRRESRIARGTKTERMAKDQSRIASSGCAIGQMWTRADGLGLPKGCHREAVRALMGFQSATARSQGAIPWVATGALEMNNSGKMKLKLVAWAASALR